MMDRIIEYYNTCWLKRFEKGHNPRSLAMHMGYYDNGTTDNDKAKIRSNQFLTEFMNLPKDRPFRIADLGCGVGGTCLYILENFPQSKITGVNISRDQVDFCISNLNGSLDHSRIEFAIENYAATSLSSGSFEYVYAIESLCHAEDKGLVMREVFRILNSGGTFCFMDYFERDTGGNGEMERLKEIFREGWAVPNYHTNSIEVLEEIGFQSIEVLDITDKIYPGIKASDAKARAILDTGNTPVDALQRSHLEACSALKKLVDAGVIKYWIVKAFKP